MELRKLASRMLIGMVVLAGFISVPALIAAQSPTGYDVDPAFQAFYDQSGGIRVFGYAAGDALTENGHLVQYFERQRLEQHSEHAGTPYAIELGLLGTGDAESRDLLTENPFQAMQGGSDGNCTFFAETGHRLCAGFKAYWERQGLEFGDAGVAGPVRLPDQRGIHRARDRADGAVLRACPLRIPRRVCRHRECYPLGPAR
jgi:hypothetical protein